MPEIHMDPESGCVTRYALERRAQTEPGRTFAVFASGQSWTVAETLDRVRSAAAGLSALGLRRGEPLLIMMPNGPDGIVALFAAQYLGAVAVPVNTAYRAGLLRHVVSGTGARIAVVHRDLLGRFVDIETAPLEHIVVPARDASSSSAIDGVVLHGGEVFESDPSEVPVLDRPIEPWDAQHVIWTSGTTGRSKGVRSTYRHAWTSVGPDSWTCLRPDDRQLLHMPIFHIGGAFIASAALCMGGSLAVLPAFRTDTFWADVRRMEVTSVFLLGAMASFLLKQSPAPTDRHHPLRHAMLVPIGANGPAFAERFGVDVYTLFNMSEISTPLMSDRNPTKPGICGRPRRGVTLRLVDGNDCEVAPGDVGELVIRTQTPWTMTHGYHGDAEATATAWRNGWFHTGDLFRVDADGDFFFVDRRKDAIRRRGENIASAEVEAEILAHPDIGEAAVIGVPSEHSEDEVMAVIAPIPGRTVDPEQLIGFLVPRLPHFMVPRYLRIVPELPKTPTAKVEKHLLRHAGIGADAWDREKAGIRLRAQKLE